MSTRRRNVSDIHTELSQSTIIAGILRELTIIMAFSLPMAIRAVARASASAAVRAATVALSTSVATGRPVTGEMMWPKLEPPSRW